MCILFYNFISRFSVYLFSSARRKKAINILVEKCPKLRLKVDGDLAWQPRPPVADDIDQAERWPRPGSLSRRCDPRCWHPASSLINLFQSLFLSISLFLPTVAAAAAACRTRRCTVPGSGESAADYEQVRRYCSSRVHARARQHRGTGQSRRWHGPAVPEGPPRQSGRHVPREGEWSLSRNTESRSGRSSCEITRIVWLSFDIFDIFLFIGRLDTKIVTKNILSSIELSSIEYERRNVFSWIYFFLREFLFLFFFAFNFQFSLLVIGYEKF